MKHAITVKWIYFNITEILLVFKLVSIFAFEFETFGKKIFCFIFYSNENGSLFYGSLSFS